MSTKYPKPLFKGVGDIFLVENLSSEKTGGLGGLRGQLKGKSLHFYRGSYLLLVGTVASVVHLAHQANRKNHKHILNIPC